MRRAAVLQELLIIFRSPHFAIAVIVCLLCMPLATFVNASRYRMELTAYEEGLAILRAPETHPVLGYDSTVEGLRPPEVLSVFSTGQRIPDRVVVTPDRCALAFRTATAGRGALPGVIDLGMIVSLLLSLMAFVFAGAVITGPRESGELRYALAGPVPRGMLLASKFTATLAALTLPLLAGTALSFAAAHMGGAGLPTTWWSYGLGLVFSSVLFLASQLALAMLVALIPARATASITFLVLVWALLALVLPRFAPLTAELLVPARGSSLEEFETDRKRAEDRVRSALVPLHDSTMRSFSLEPERVQLPMNPSASPAEIRAQEAYWRIAEPIVRSLEEGFREQIAARDAEEQASDRRRESWAGLLRSFSPVGVFDMLAAELSGSGPGEMRRLRANAAEFTKQASREIYSRFERRYYGRSGTAVLLLDARVPPPATYPLFVYRPSGPAERMSNVIPHLVVLCAYLGIFLAGLWWRFRSLEVRP